MSFDPSRRTPNDDALRSSQAQLDVAMDLAQLAPWEFDAASATFSFNDRLYRLYGTTAEREGGYTMTAESYAAAFLLPEEQSMVAEAVAQLIECPGKHHQFEHRIRRRDGEVRHIVVRFAPVVDETGRVVGSRGVNQDVTERKRAEVAVRESQAQATRLEGQLLQAQKMESVGRLAGGVAHDFNNMLGVILGHVDLALGCVESSHPVVDDLLAIRAAAARSADLTRQLLGFARRQAVTPRLLDLNACVDASLAMLRRLIGEDIELAWQPHTGPASVRMDPSQVDQILTNLCVNARDAIADVGRITIETATVALDESFCARNIDAVPGEYIRLTVADTGCGMDDDTRARLFEPFFTTKEIGKGTGLGLATLYGIVKQNDGFVEVESQPGKGTLFSIYLPRQRGEEERPVVRRATRRPAAGHETVLVVEDDPSLLKLVTRMLKGRGYAVLPARSPEEAMQLADQSGEGVHLLISDVVMPGMNGRDLAAAVTARHPHIKPLFTSGYTADVIAHHGVLGEGMDFIQKPFTVDALMTKVRQVLDRE